MVWTDAAKRLFFLDGVAGTVASGTAAGATIKLNLTAPSTSRRITYLKGTAWDHNAANIIYGANGIAALTFADVEIGEIR